MPEKKILLKKDKLKNQIEESLRSFNPAEFPNFDLIKAKSSLVNSDIGQAYFYFGQYLEKNKSPAMAKDFYITGAEDFNDADCKTKLNRTLTSEKLSVFLTYSITDLFIIPIWIFLELLFRTIYQTVIKRPVKYITLFRINRIIFWIALIGSIILFVWIFN